MLAASSALFCWSSRWLRQRRRSRRDVWAAVCSWLSSPRLGRRAAGAARPRRSRRRSKRGRSTRSVDDAPPERAARVDGHRASTPARSISSRSATAEGRLPNFGRILDAGAVHAPRDAASDVGRGRVGGGRDRQAAAEKRRPLGRHLPAAAVGGDDRSSCCRTTASRTGSSGSAFWPRSRTRSATLRARTLWSILSTARRLASASSNWPLTHPAPAVRGYRRQRHVSPRGAHAGRASTIRLRSIRRSCRPTRSRDRQSVADEPPAVPAASTAVDAERHQRRRRGSIAIYDRIARALAPAHADAGDDRALPEPRSDRALLPALRDAVGVRRRHATTSAGGSAGARSATTRSIDEAIGRAMAALGPDDLLLVVSGFGMEPLGLGKRLLEQLIGDPDISGTHEAAPDGFLMAYGAPVAQRPPAAPRVGRGRRADDPVLPRPADRPRHGRLRAHRSVPAGVHRRAADHVHPDLRPVNCRLQISNSD